MDGGSVSASSASGIKNEYNTQYGVKASTTGNVYGVYDMSGGAQEIVACFDDLVSADSSGNKTIENENAGLPMTSDAKDKNGNYISTKYVTLYSGMHGSSSSLSKIYSIGKLGDATKEVFTKTSNTSGNGWLNDNLSFDNTTSGFMIRGGLNSGQNKTGIFHLTADTAGGGSGGTLYPFNAFRIILCP